MATIQEEVGSRRSAQGLNPWAEIRYKIFDAASDVVARNLLATTAPSAFDLYGTGSLIVALTDLEVEPDSNISTMFYGTARYGLINVDAAETTFDISTTSAHITQSLQTARYPATAPNHLGAIGVTPDGVAGVDISVPVTQFTETHYFPESQITNTYKGTLATLTGKVNLSTFKGFASGECMFLGATLTRRLDGIWPATFRFAVERNRSGLTIGSITGIAKQGFDYLWVDYEIVEDATANTLTRRPRAVYVERVYERDNFGLLGIGT